MKLGIFCPGSPPRPEAMEKGLAWLAAQGFALVQAENMVVGEGLHAGSPQTRARDFHRLLRDPEVDAILCARGGSGTLGLLPHLDLSLLQDHLKPVIGMSDVTALHLTLFARCGRTGISGQMAVQLSSEMPGFSAEGWLALVRGPFPLGPVPMPEGMRLSVLGDGPGEAEGALLPCNLSLLASLIGTPYLPSLRDSILVLEDIQETPQSLDRLVTQLSLSGVTAGVRGIVLGQFTDCRPRGEGVREEEGRVLLQEWARSLGVPALLGFPYGHGTQSRALPFGTRARITCTPPALHLLESFGSPVARR